MSRKDRGNDFKRGRFEYLYDKYEVCNIIFRFFYLRFFIEEYEV